MHRLSIREELVRGRKNKHVLFCDTVVLETLSTQRLAALSISLRDSEPSTSKSQLLSMAEALSRPNTKRRLRRDFSNSTQTGNPSPPARQATIMMLAAIASSVRVSVSFARRAVHKNPGSKGCRSRRDLATSPLPKVAPHARQSSREPRRLGTRSARGSGTP